MLDDPIVHRYFSDARMEWYFNLEKAPLVGSFFERLVKSAKRCLKRTIGQAKLTFDELSTVVTEVKMIINSCPLSYVSTKDLEKNHCLPPLLLGHWLLSLPAFTIEEDSNDLDFQVGPLLAADFTRRLRHLSMTMDQFWKRRRKEHLLELRECHRYAKWTQSPCDPLSLETLSWSMIKIIQGHFGG